MGHKTDHYSMTQLDQIINEKYSVSFMNDSKWDRLIGRLTEIFIDGLHVRYKLIQGETVYETCWTTPDFKPFFAEPTLYKEVEWVEFPVEYKDFVNPDNLKAGKRAYSQDVSAIEREIMKIGQFKLKRLTGGLRLYAYS